MHRLSPLTRRQFLKLGGAGLAGLSLNHCSPFLSRLPISTGVASRYSLRMDAQGVIYGGPFLQVPADAGGVAVLHNLATTLSRVGFYCGLGGEWIPYTDLEEQAAWVADGVLAFDGRLPGTGVWLKQRISTDGTLVRFDLTLEDDDGALELPGLEWASFAFDLPIALFGGHTFRADGETGSYPQTEPDDNDLLPDGCTLFEMCIDDPDLQYTIHAPDGVLLYDTRVWGGYFYELSVVIPVEIGHATFTLAPPPTEPGPNPPALRHSQVGYLPHGDKWAVLEIDWRDEWPADLGVHLERQTPTGAEVVLSGRFTPVLERYRKKFALFDFSAVREAGHYRIAWSGGQSDWFVIGPGVYTGLWQLALDNFLPLEMCHLAVDLGDGKRAHEPCHLDDGIQAQPYTVGPDGFISYEGDAGPGPGQPISAPVGGWHDAGDYDLNVAAQAYVVHILALAWEEFAPSRDVNRLDVAGRRLHIGRSSGRPDLLEQIEWGVRWLLTMQKDDGHVYVGVVEQSGVYGESILPEETTDGQTGSGDEREVYVDLHSDVLLKFSIATAAASRVLRGYDDNLADECWQAAQRAWDYFQAHTEVYRPTVYFYSDCEGREQMIIAAATELYLTDPRPEYLNALAAFTDYLRDWPTDWPTPTATGHHCFWYAGPFLARLWPHLAPGELKDAVDVALNRAAEALHSRCVGRPFPVSIWDIPDWGSNGLFLGRLYDTYWLGKVRPQQVTLNDGLSYAHWFFGLHPLNDYAFVFGAGLPEPRYLYNGILAVRFGDEPASVPGAVVPGLAAYTGVEDQGGIALYYLDWPLEYRNGEACIYDAAIFIFDMLALERLGEHRVYLPAVMKPSLQET